MAKEQSHDCEFEFHMGFASSRRPRCERVYVAAVEVTGGNSFPFHPSGKGSDNRSLLAKRPLCVTSVAKLLKKGFDLIIQQLLLCPAGPTCRHEVLLVMASLPVGRGDTIMPRQGPSKGRQAALER